MDNNKIMFKHNNQMISNQKLKHQEINPIRTNQLLMIHPKIKKIQTITINLKLTQDLQQTILIQTNNKLIHNNKRTHLIIKAKMLFKIPKEVSNHKKY